MMVKKYKIKKGDQVVILTGKDKGKKGNIIDIVTKRNRVLIQGISMVKRHTKPSAASKGGIEHKESSVHISNVSIADPKDGKPSKIGFKFLDKGKKVRFSKRSGEVID